MAKSKSIFESKGFKTVMAKVYGWGAAVVILGALFKIQHWEGAGIMLTVGLGTEALIFFISAFEPVHGRVEWERVYPELRDDYEKGPRKSINSEIEKMLKEAQIESSMVKKLGDSMRNISLTADKMADISKATVATKDYTDKVKLAATTLDKANDSYKTVASAMDELSKSSSVSKDYFNNMKTAATATNDYAQKIKTVSTNVDTVNKAYGAVAVSLNELNKNSSAAKGYFEQIAVASSVTKDYSDKIKNIAQKVDDVNKTYADVANAMTQFKQSSEKSKAYFDQMNAASGQLQSLNALYEMQIKEEKGHIDAVNKYKEGLVKAGDLLENMPELGSISSASENLKKQFVQLNANLSSLNKVYGNMLTAMSAR